MKITFNKQTALIILRRLRSEARWAKSLQERIDLSPPNAVPQQHWTRSLLEAVFSQCLVGEVAPWQIVQKIAGGLQAPKVHPNGRDGHAARNAQAQQAERDAQNMADISAFHIAVPSSATRPKSSCISNTVYSHPLPAGAFINLGSGIALSGPELLFAEMAATLRPIELLMLGHELCGTFSRDPWDPYGGDITYGLQPITSAKRINEFLSSTAYVRGIDNARHVARYLNDNAWSPTESLIAALLRLPTSDFGYDIGPLRLNPRYNRKQHLPDSKTSRVPDIMIEGSRVGVNYDGLVHLDLESIARAALEMGANPGATQAERELEEAIRNVRTKALDDIRRNRELTVAGLTVFPVTKEDLYPLGGLDALIAQILEQIEAGGRDMSRQKQLLGAQAFCKARHEIVLSLLPGSRNRNVQVGRFIEGYEVLQGRPMVHECLIEL